MNKTISNPIQKWAATMALVVLQLVVLAVVAILMIVWLPAGYYGTILFVIAALGVAMSALTGLVIRWLVAD